MKSTNESRFLKTGNSMAGDESENDSNKFELTDEGRLALRVDLAYWLTHEAVENYDGIENAAIYFDSKLESIDDGLLYKLSKCESRTGKDIDLYYCDSEVQEI